MQHCMVTAVFGALGCRPAYEMPAPGVLHGQRRAILLAWALKCRDPDGPGSVKSLSSGASRHSDAAPAATVQLLFRVPLYETLQCARLMCMSGAIVAPYDTVGSLAPLVSLGLSWQVMHIPYRCAVVGTCARVLRGPMKRCGEPWTWSTGMCRTEPDEDRGDVPGTGNLIV